MTEIVLASQSPRRRHLLKAMGVEFTVHPSNYTEVLDDNKDIHEVARELSLGKAMDVARLYPDAVVIGSDTIVGMNNRQLEKPVDIEDARRMLLSYAGHESIVVTGLAVVCLSRRISEVTTDLTKVYFKPDSLEITKLREDYLVSNDWKDKAGGYAIQNLRGILIDRIEGSYDTVVGLPTQPLATILGKLGIAAEAVEVSADLTYDD